MAPAAPLAGRQHQASREKEKGRGEEEGERTKEEEEGEGVTKKISYYHRHARCAHRHKRHGK